MGCHKRGKEDSSCEVSLVMHLLIWLLVLLQHNRKAEDTFWGPLTLTDCCFWEQVSDWNLEPNMNSLST